MTPAVKGMLTDMALRTPTMDVSGADLTVKFKKETTWRRSTRRRNAAQALHERLPYLAEEALAPTDFETNPISFTFEHTTGIRLGTTFVKIVCRDASCRVVDLFGHMAKVDAKPEGELLAAAERNPNLSKAKINEDKQDPTTI